jgi:DNA primase
VAAPFVELEVGERVVKQTNPDKVLFPGARKTKLDLAEYYVAVDEGIVRALYERPTQLRASRTGSRARRSTRQRVPEKRPDWVGAARVRFPLGSTTRCATSTCCSSGSSRRRRRVRGGGLPAELPEDAR